MKLQFQQIKQTLPKVVGPVFLGLLTIFMIRVLVWEHFYYKSQNGRERQTPEVHAFARPTAEQRPLDETHVTEEKKLEHVVPPLSPRYLSVPKLGISKARIIAVGTLANGAMGAPNSIFDVGWWNQSGRPGRGSTGLFNGHNGGPNINGIFKQLPKLRQGDELMIERGDGRVYTYTVTDTRIIPLDQADAAMQSMIESPIEDQESVSFITCTGDWSYQRHTFLSRHFLRAVLKQQ